MRPPAVPQLTHIFACRFFKDIQIGRLQQTGSPEEQCFAVANIFTQQPQRQALCKKHEGKFVFLVPERTGYLLEKRFVASMGVNLVANPVRFLSQSELRCGIQRAAYSFFGQILEGRLTAPRPRQWDICVKNLGQRRGIDAHLRDIAVRFCAREKFTVTSLDKNVKHSRFESRIDRVTVCFPTTIKQIDFDTAANRLARIYPNCSITKVRTSFAVPGAELDDLDFVFGSDDKMFAEISGKPARLQLQLGWDSRRLE